MSDIIKKNGYQDLDKPDYTSASWFVHLVLIYYKRNFCNKHKYKDCPLQKIMNIKYRCKK